MGRERDSRRSGREKDGRDGYGDSRRERVAVASESAKEREVLKGRDDKEHARGVEKYSDSVVDRDMGREREHRHGGREKERDGIGGLRDHAKAREVVKVKDEKEYGRVRVEKERDRDVEGRERDGRRGGREKEKEKEKERERERERERDSHSGTKRKAAGADGLPDDREKRKRVVHEDENGERTRGRLAETGPSDQTRVINGSSAHLNHKGNGVPPTANGLSSTAAAGAPGPISGSVASSTAAVVTEAASAGVRGDSRPPSIVPVKEETTTTPSASAAKESETQQVKAPNVSLDALAKAKRALQMQKDLAEKLKKLPQLKQPISEAATAPSSSSTVPTSELTSSQAGETQSGQGVMPSPGAIPPNMLGMMPGMLPGMIPGMPGVGMPNLGALSNYDAVKRAQEFAMRLGFHQVPFGMPLLPTMIPTHLPEEMGGVRNVKAPVLRLDTHGREVDEHGNVVERSKVTNVSTLKVNINKQKKEAFQILRPELEEDPVDHPYFDTRVAIDKKKLVRPKRSTFQFVEEGKWSKQAEMQKLRGQYGEAKAKEIKAKQAALSKAKAEADINPNLIEVSERVPTKEEKPKDSIPDIEWWDSVFLLSKNYEDIEEGKVKEEKVTIFVEHPVPIEPPAEPAPPPPQPLKLTKKEQKKLRTQRRLAKEKDRQEMIRQGLLEPPKSKVKMSNLMKVLGAEATQDPTRLEQEIRSAAAEREQAHTDRNLARKLTPAERREKKAKKLFDDAMSIETIVSVYRVLDLSHQQTRFKVDLNATQNRLTGCVVISDAMCVVIVEGGAKSIKRYNKLMTRRINWATAVKEETEEGVEEEAHHRANKCDLVWQGSVARPNFEKFLIQQFRSAAAARKYLADADVGHYWDLAVNFREE